MRLIIEFYGRESLNLPFNYNEILQSLIYQNLDKELALFLHNEGFRDGKRSLKLFTFSRILGKIKYFSNKFEVLFPFKLVVSSPYFPFLESLAENLLNKPELNLINQKVFVSSIKVSFKKIAEKETLIKMLSPLTVYRTRDRRTYYKTPWDEDFKLLIKENLIRKVKAFYRKKLERAEFFIKPEKVNEKDLKIVKYKGTIIKGWMGIYRISGSPELLQIAYDAGLGAKNSQGFGCFEVIQNYES